MEKQASGQPPSGIALAIVREAALLRSLRHENIISMHGLVIGRLRIHMLMELCCCSLRNHLRHLLSLGNDSMDPEQLVSFSLQLFGAIEHCHDQYCLHRDIKPDNLLLDCDRRTLKLADFGMARLVAPAPPPPAASPPLTPGTVSAWYRPPEVVLGDPAYGRPVDLWSAGCVVAEMINLEPVFAADSEVRDGDCRLPRPWSLAAVFPVVSEQAS